jgi:hypothetical protein
MMDSMKKDDLIRMLVTMWAIWHAKRKVIFEEIYQSPMATVAFVNRFLLDLEATREAPSSMAGAMVRGRRATARAPQPKWIAPPAGQDKINVDATVAKSEKKGAVAAVCRSRDGVYLGATATVYARISHLGTLEALACREALDAADVWLQIASKL